MSADRQFELSVDQAAKLAKQQYPQLAAAAREVGKIDDEERRLLYEAERAGHSLPLHAKRWKHASHLAFHDRLVCPGCGHTVSSAEPGPLACDGCGNVYIVAPPKPRLIRPALPDTRAP